MSFGRSDGPDSVRAGKWAPSTILGAPTDDGGFLVSPVVVNATREGSAEIRAFVAAAVALVEPLFHAMPDDALEATLRGLVTTQAMQEYATAARAAASVLRARPSGSSVETIRRRLEVFGPAVVHTIDRGDRMVFELVRAVASASEEAGAPVGLDLLSVTTTKNPWIDHRVPVAVRKAVHDAVVGVLALLALDVAISTKGHHLTREAATVLAAAYANGAKQALRLNAMHPRVAAEIPDSVLPAAERLDLAAVLAEQQRVERWIEAEAAEHARRGGVYFPLGDDDD